MFEYLLISVTLIFLFLFYHIVVKIYLAAWRFKQMDPNLKTFITPFFGLQRVFKENIAKFGDSHRFLKELAKENPEEKAYLTNFGTQPLLILCDAQLIKEVLLNPKKFRKFNVMKHSRQSFDRGLFFAEDELWSNARGIIRHSFTHEQLKAMIPTMQNTITLGHSILRRRIEESGQKSVVYRVIQDTEILLGQIMVKIFFSEEGARKKIGNTPLSVALAEYTNCMFNRSRSGLNILSILFFGEKAKDINFSQKDRQLFEMLGSIRSRIQEILDKRMALKDDPEKDFIQHYISEQRRVEQLIAEAEAKGVSHNYVKITKEDIMHQLVSFYFAGIDTTSHLLAFALYALAQYPQFKQRVIDEIKANIKDLNSITYETLSKLQFMSNFLDECLRMWPPGTSILARVTRQDTQIGPFKIPANTLIGANILGLMYNPKYYQDPEIFKPDRWNNKGAHPKQAYSFIPFSTGPRNCIGKYLALMEAKLILVNLLNQFDITRTEIPLRLHARLLYEPIQQDLVRFHAGGIGLR